MSNRSYFNGYLWLSEISNGSVEILGQTGMSVNLKSGKMAEVPVPFTDGRWQGVCFSRSPIVFEYVRHMTVNPEVVSSPLGIFFRRSYELLAVLCSQPFWRYSLPGPATVIEKLKQKMAGFETYRRVRATLRVWACGCHPPSPKHRFRSPSG